MNPLKRLLRYWLVDRHKRSVNEERIQFVRTSLSQQAKRAEPVCVYFLATCITKAQLVAQGR